MHSHNRSCVLPSSTSHGYRNEDNDSEANSEESFEGELSLVERRIHQSVIDSCYDYDMMDESTSSDDDKFFSESEIKFRSHIVDSDSIGSLHSNDEKKVDNTFLGIGSTRASGKKSHQGEGPKRSWKKTDLSQFRRVPRAFWPHWVYCMHDSYCLAERAAGTSFVQHPSLCDYIFVGKQSKNVASYLKFVRNEEFLHMHGLAQNLLSVSNIINGLVSKILQICGNR